MVVLLCAAWSSVMTATQINRRPDTARVALAATLAALASLISISGLSVPFPLMPFLRFDAAEIPDALAFLLLGPTGGLAVTTIHWMTLNLSASFDPVVGPTMKFMAVFATLLGMYVGTLFLGRGSSDRRSFLSLLVWGTALRFLIMLPVTFALYYLVFPATYLTFAAKALAAAGIMVSGQLATAIAVTLATALFNVMHAVITISASWGLYRTAGRMKVIRPALDWFGQRLGRVEAG
ncbi:MAG: hypothetical protein JRN29_03055 [Nitrososphaerota archaeon]|nr:hypothetical protein [Nitrososphaerota archaeon]